MDEINETYDTYDFPFQSFDEKEEKRNLPGNHDENPKLLEPDHPLLERFQQLLKEHLLKQIERVKSEVYELETGIKKENEALEKVGIEVYEMQQLVDKQQKTIDNYVQDLLTLTASTEEVENQLRDSNSKQKQEQTLLDELEKKEKELVTEIESTDMMINELSKWEKDIESGLLINKRVAEKTRKDKIQAASEKKQQDMLLFKLTNEVWKLERELDIMTAQLRIKEDEREKYAESVTLANIDIETQENENKCLLQGWQSLIVTISSRDKHYNSTLEMERTLRSTLASIKTEIVQIKKLSSKELAKRKGLQQLKRQLEAEINNAKITLEEEIQRKADYDREVAKYDAIDKQVKKDIARVQQEIKILNVHFIDVSKEYNKVNEKKIKIEEATLEILQRESSEDSQAIKISKLIKQKKDAMRAMKIIIAQRENAHSLILSEIQSTEILISETQKRINELKKQIDIENENLNICKEENENRQKETIKKTRLYEILKKKLEKCDEEDSSSHLSPDELKIKTLEGQLFDTQEKIKEMQKFWLREQSIVVDLVEKRQDQIESMNMLKKQITILQQKNLKIADDLEYYKKQETRMDRNINNLQTQLLNLTESLAKKKDNKEELDASNALELSSLSTSLEESEFESLKLKAEIGDIEEEKVSLSKELIEKNREALCWEKKINLALEAKKSFEKERSEEGEIGRMKAEIHRMNVRYGQLKRVQEKLMQDLEQCITRRDSMITLAEVKVKAINNGTLRVRVGFNKKIEDMENKIKQINSDQENFEKRISSKSLDIETIKMELNAVEEEIGKLEDELKDVTRRVEEKHIDVQFNLEMLVFKQQKLKVYIELAKGNAPYSVYKTESALNVAYNREKELNSKLRNVVENLLADLPSHKFFLTKIHNLLVLAIMKV